MKQQSYFIIVNGERKYINYLEKANISTYLFNYYKSNLDETYEDVKLNTIVDVIDNSFVINLETGKPAYISTQCHSNEENNAYFRVVTEPYFAHVNLDMNSNLVLAYQFVDVQSSKTNKYYRVLTNSIVY